MLKVCSQKQSKTKQKQKAEKPKTQVEVLAFAISHGCKCYRCGWFQITSATSLSTVLGKMSSGILLYSHIVFYHTNPREVSNFKNVKLI